MTKYYGIMPWDIGKLTLFQWQDYMEHIEKIYKIFHPQPEKGSASSAKTKSTTGMQELAKAARIRGIKLPSKGL